MKYRSSRPEVSYKKRCPEISSKFIRELPCRSVISIKLFCNFIEITLRYGCSPVNLLHIFRTPFIKNTRGWLLLFWVDTYEYSETVGLILDTIICKQLCHCWIRSIFSCLSEKQLLLTISQTDIFLKYFSYQHQPLKERMFWLSNMHLKSL